MSDELGFNKIAGAVLATALTFIVVKELAHAAYHPHLPDVPAYGADILAAAEAAANAGIVEEIILPFPQQDWLDAMNASAGETIAKKCIACHTFDKGGAGVTGPNLFGIVGTAAAQREGFTYSSAMKDSGITWDFETLNDYLEKPTRYVKGTNMVFVGLKKPEQRAAMIEYLRMAADTPLPRPALAVMDVTADDAQMIETEAMMDDMMPDGDHAHTDADAHAHEDGH